MKHLLILFLLLIAASISHAISNITFSGGGYEISVLLSDELVVPATKSHPYFELKSTQQEGPYLCWRKERKRIT